jgi:hypothetical protein
MQLEVPLGQSLTAAGCRGCGRVFTTVGAFDKHQRLADGGVTCLDPAAIGLERKPSGIWGYKSDERSRARQARPAVGEPPGAPSTPAPVPGASPRPSALQIQAVHNVMDTLEELSKLSGWLP